MRDIFKIDVILVFIVSYFLVYGFYVFSDNIYLHARAVDSFSMAVSDRSELLGDNFINIELHNYLEESIQEGEYKENTVRREALEIDLRQFDRIESYKQSPDLLKDGERGLYSMIRFVWSLSEVNNIDVVIKALIIFGSMNAAMLYLLAKKLNFTKHFPIILLCIYLFYTPSYEYLLYMKNHWYVIFATTFSVYMSILIREKRNFIPYLIFIVIFLSFFTIVRTPIKFLIILPILSIFLNQHMDNVRKFLFSGLAILIFVASFFSLSYANNPKNITTGHSIWFPVFVGMGEANSGFIPFPDDGYALGYDKDLSPRSAEWDEALKNQVIQWYTHFPNKVIKIYLYRIDKMINPENIFLGKFGVNHKRYKAILDRLGLPEYISIFGSVFLFLFALFVLLKFKANLYVIFYLLLGVSMSFFQGLLVMVKSHSYYFSVDLVYIFLISILIAFIVHLLLSISAKISSWLTINKA